MELTNYIDFLRNLVLNIYHKLAQLGQKKYGKQTDIIDLSVLELEIYTIIYRIPFKNPISPRLEVIEGSATIYDLKRHNTGFSFKVKNKKPFNGRIILRWTVEGQYDYS